MHEITGRQPKRVLIVEDNNDFAAMMQMMLETTLPGETTTGTRADDPQPDTHEGMCIHGQWIVTVAGTLATATDLLHHNQFDIALLDLILPDGNRDDIVRIVGEAAPKMPLVVQSGLTDSDMVRRMLCEGHVADYIVKGDINSPITLKQRLCHAIDRFHLMQDAEAVSQSIANNSPMPVTGLYHCCM